MKQHNENLYLGVFLLIVGIILTIYSVSSYSEIKSLEKKIDFELIDDNNKLSYEDKFAQYQAISEYLNKKLDKNKNLPIKTTSCSYLNYAKHNSIEMYKLANKRKDNPKHKNLAASNIRTLHKKISDYNTCKNAIEYRNEFDAIILEIENQDKVKAFDEQRMLKFIDGYYDRKLEESMTQENTTIETPILEEPIFETTNFDTEIDELNLENYIDTPETTP